MPVSIETDVLIVGAGPAGLAAAATLSTYGVANSIVTKYGWLSDTPRAHITNQRTMEVLRDLGLEQAAIAQSSAQSAMANNVFCHSLAGEEFGRLYSWGNHPRRKADYDLASPTSICDIPQTLLEPILLNAAAQRGTKIRFNSARLSAFQAARHRVSTNRFSKATGITTLSAAVRDMNKLWGDHRTRRTAAIASLKVGWRLSYQAAGWG